MKATVVGFNQAAALEAGVSLQELVFLDWFVYWYGTGTMKAVPGKDGRYYGWINRRYVIDQLPILGCSHVNSVSRMIGRLKEKGFLESVTVSNEKSRGSLSYFRPARKVFELISGDQQTVGLSGQADQQTVGLSGQVRPPNRSVNPYTPTLRDTPTGIYKEGSANGAEREKAVEIVDHLNKAAGRSYRYTDSTIRLIQARLKEGFTVEECKRVIDKKSSQWLGSDFEKFLRPATLFRASKFEGYLQEKGKSKQDATELPLEAFQ